MGILSLSHLHQKGILFFYIRTHSISEHILYQNTFYIRTHSIRDHILHNSGHLILISSSPKRHRTYLYQNTFYENTFYIKTHYMRSWYLILISSPPKRHTRRPRAGSKGCRCKSAQQQWLQNAAATQCAARMSRIFPYMLATAQDKRREKLHSLLQTTHTYVTSSYTYVTSSYTYVTSSYTYVTSSYTYVLQTTHHVCHICAARRLRYI